MRLGRRPRYRRHRHRCRSRRIMAGAYTGLEDGQGSLMPCSTTCCTRRADSGRDLSHRRVPSSGTWCARCGGAGLSPFPRPTRGRSLPFVRARHPGTHLEDGQGGQAVERPEHARLRLHRGRRSPPTPPELATTSRMWRYPQMRAVRRMGFNNSGRMRPPSACGCATPGDAHRRRCEHRQDQR